jgi:hypothetical protein
VFWTWVLSGGEAGSFALDNSNGFAYATGEEDEGAKAGRGRRRPATDTILANVEASARITVSASLPNTLVNAPPEPEPDSPEAESEADEFPEIEDELARIIETTTPESERAS